MYSISDFGEMIMDERRTDAYIAALKRAITPDAIVLDIGTGTGIFAMLACQFGARHVYAIEPSDAVHLARRLANENGYGERITFIQDLSTRVTLPECATVIISDLHGVLPYYQIHLPSIMDARERHLAPGGILIPQQDTLWVTVVTASEQYEEYVKPWLANKYDLKMELASHIVTNLWGRGKVKLDDFLVKPQPWMNLDYRTVTSPNVSATLSWKAEQNGIAHGLCAWFETKVADDISLSNAPGEPELVYGHAFFPLENPVKIDIGDEINLQLDATLLDDDYIWRWDTKVRNPANGLVKANFKQSTFHSMIVSPAQLAKKRADYKAVLNEDAEVDRYILTMMDGSKSLGQIADSLRENFPQQFKSRNDALGRVGKLSQAYSR